MVFERYVLHIYGIRLNKSNQNNLVSKLSSLFYITDKLMHNLIECLEIDKIYISGSVIVLDTQQN